MDEMTPVQYDEKVIKDFIIYVLEHHVTPPTSLLDAVARLLKRVETTEIVQTVNGFEVATLKTDCRKLVRSRVEFALGHLVFEKCVQETVHDPAHLLQRDINPADFVSEPPPVEFRHKALLLKRA